MTARISVHALLLACLLPAAALAGTLDARPDSSLSPQQVVRCQMEALRDNDTDDRGIAAAFRFASPSNKRVTGPLPRFAEMIKNSPYSVMLRPQLIDYGEVEVRDDQAQLQVSVLTRDYVAVVFRFYLSRQTHADCDGCWMTDGVAVEKAQRLPGLNT